MNKVIVIVTIIHYYWLLSSASTKSPVRPVNSTAQQRLFNHLFANYRKELRPAISERSGPTNVTVQLYLKQIQKVIESDQILKLYCWLEEYWKDEFLTWNPIDFDHITSIHVPADIIWVPDLLVYNNANMNVKENELQTNALIDSNGRISLFRAIITDITCDLDMQKFPFDQQICFIMLASWSYDGSQVLLQTNELDDNKTNLANLKHYIPNTEWRLIDFKYRTNHKYYECCPHPYPDISYFFSIKRNPSYYLFTLIVPSAFITVVTVVGFFTPHSSSGENTEKVSLGVTALLSLAIILMMVSDKLPATSNIVPLLGKYYIGLIVIMFSATCCTTLTLNIQMRGNAGHPLPSNVHWWVNCRLSKLCCIQWLFGRELCRPAIKLANIDACRQYYDVTSHRGSIISNGKMSPTAPAMTNNNKHNTIYHQQRPIANKIDSSSSIMQQLYVLTELLKSVQEMHNQLNLREQLHAIRRQWQMLTRVIEKLLMSLFIVFTTLFAIFMLYDDQPLPFISEQYMIDKAHSL